jgi:hydrophobic/amphiphilic exporter-1 (mainly G- bacteria), HAE1 family
LVQVELPEGYNLDETAKVVNTIEDKIKHHDEVKHILTDIGKKSDLDIGANMASMIVQLVDVKDRDISLV